MYDDEELAEIWESHEGWEDNTLSDFLEYGKRKESFVPVLNHARYLNGHNVIVDDGVLSVWINRRR